MGANVHDVDELVFAVFVIIFPPPGFAILFGGFALFFLRLEGCLVAVLCSKALFLPNVKTHPRLL